MTYSIYEEICALQEQGTTQKELRTKLIDLGVYTIFKEVYEMYHARSVFVKVVFFIAHAYSWESKKIVIGKDWGRVQLDIARDLELPEDITNDLIELKDINLADACQGFMRMYQDNVDFVHVQKLKQMYRRIIDVGTAFKAEDDGNADLDDNFENIERAEKLLKKIMDHEERMKRKYRLLTVPASELAEKLGSNYKVDSLRVEDSLLIKKQKQQ